MTNTVAPEAAGGAWEFMKFMWKTDSQVGWHLVGSYLPTTQAAAAHPRVMSLLGGRPGGADAEDRLRPAAAGRSGRPGPQIGPYPQYDEAVRKSLESMAFDGASPDDAIAQAQEAIQAALTQYIEDNAPN